MDRREFLKTSSVAGAFAVGSGHLLARADNTQTHPLPAELESKTATAAPLLQLENEHLSFVLFSDATARITDRKNHAEWRIGPVALQEETEIDIGHVWYRSQRSICEQYPGRFRGRKEGEYIRFWLTGREDQVKGSFLVHVILDGPWLEFRLLEIEEQLPSLNFPPAIESKSLVLPMHVGRWIRKPVRDRVLYTFPSPLNMRWFGGLNEHSGWIAVLPEDNYADSGVMVTELSSSLTWLKELGRWKQPRAVRYQFISGSYVELAMVYRDWAKQKGIHRALSEKLIRTPALANLTQGRVVSIVEAKPLHGKGFDEDLLRRPEDDPMLGSGPHVMFTHAQVEKCIRDLPRVGVDRALVVVRGWIAGGYDYSHPDIWPPEPQLGSVIELKQLCAGTDGVTVALHDNYQDIYAQSKSWPKGVIRTRNGERMAGGYWAGGQAYILNARDGLFYAKRNWDSLAQLQMKALFIDTTSAVQMYQSYEAGNTLTRSEDMAEKIELMRFFKSKGLVLGSEEGADFAVPYLDWNENRHSRQPGESIPLWPLVFHDAIVATRYTSDIEQADGRAPFWLEDMLWGYAAMSYIEDYQHRETELLRMGQQKQVDAWFRQISTAAMTDHHFLAGDNSLEETSYSTGQRIVVNFANEPQTHQGIEIPSYGYKISTPSI